MPMDNAAVLVGNFIGSKVSSFGICDTRLDIRFLMTTSASARVSRPRGDFLEYDWAY